MLIDAARALRFGHGSAEHAAYVCYAARQPSCLACKIDNVVAYVDGQFATPGTPISLLDDLPNVAPLAPIMWFEWDDSAVLLCVVLDGTDDRDAARAAQSADAQHDLAMAMPDGARWCYLTSVCVVDADGTLLNVLPFGRGLYVSAQGRLLGQQYAFTHFTDTDPALADNPAHISFLLMALMSLCFAHCKGVTLAEHQPSRQQRRATERAGRPPLVAYKTIDIAPARRVMRSEGQIEKSGLAKALHICRGHFAHYAPGHYFGRNAEPLTVFRPMHVRGRAEQGVVVKDYRVLPGDDKAGHLPASRHDAPRLKERQDQR